MHSLYDFNCNANVYVHCYYYIFIAFALLLIKGKLNYIPVSFVIIVLICWQFCRLNKKRGEKLQCKSSSIWCVCACSFWILEGKKKQVTSLSYHFHWIHFMCRQKIFFKVSYFAKKKKEFQFFFHCNK